MILYLEVVLVGVVEADADIGVEVGEAGDVFEGGGVLRDLADELEAVFGVGLHHGLGAGGAVLEGSRVREDAREVREEAADRVREEAERLLAGGGALCERARRVGGCAMPARVVLQRDEELDSQRRGDGREPRTRDGALLVQRAVLARVGRRDHVVAEVTPEALAPSLRT